VIVGGKKSPPMRFICGKDGHDWNDYKWERSTTSMHVAGKVVGVE